MNTATLLFTLTLSLVPLLPPGDASAHRVNLFAWVEGETVHTEAKYPDGTLVKEGLIRVLDRSGRELLQGKTNDRGEFSFPIPLREDLTIVLEAGMGHRADWPLSAAELGGGPAAAAPSPAPASGPAAAAASLSPAELEQALEKALDRKLAPVVKMMAELHAPRARLSDVVGGLGWIVGLAGFAVWLKSRRRGGGPA
ncbi:MAG: hypothetical protein WHT06_08210 [Desulfobacterales bacterium]